MQKLTLRPGINVQRTQLLNEGGWSDGNCIRFREGMPEVLGGWLTLIPTVLIGVARGMHAWATLAGTPSLGIGTNLRLYVIQGTSAFDITPVAASSTPTNPFHTTGSQSNVLVIDAAMPAAIQGTLQVGGEVFISGASAVGGLTLFGLYNVVSGTGPSYTITAAGAASSTATGGGTPTINYYVQGPVNSGVLFQGQMPPALTWTLDNFGEQLIACPRGGTIYVWVPPSGTGTRAVAISGAPAQVTAIFVSNGAEQIVALGAVPPSGGDFDPMLVAWCNSGDYNTWLASATNNAGDFHLTDGSVLLWGGRAAQQNLIWSDTALYSMQFIGGELIYSFQQLGTSCGLIGPHAGGIVNAAAFWMSNLNFMMYNGTVQVIDCPVWDIVFKNLNTQEAAKISCGINSQFNEVRWDYPSASATENDSYVIFNYVDNTWYYGSAGNSGIVVQRTTWEDTSVFGTPISVDPTGNVWQHEVLGVYTAGNSPMPWSITSGFIDISQGEQMMFVDWVIPDQILTSFAGTTQMAMNVLISKYPSDNPQLAQGATFTITQATESVVVRGRGRQIAFQFAAGAGFNEFWRLGALRIRAAPDGRN